MEVQANGHTKRTTRRAARKASGAASKAASQTKSVVMKAEGVVHDAERAVDESKPGSFIRRNPKTAVGVAIGAGLVIGALANRKYLRVTTLALAAYLGKRFF